MTGQYLIQLLILRNKGMPKANETVQDNENNFAEWSFECRVWPDFQGFHAEVDGVSKQLETLASLEVSALVLVEVGE